MLRCADIYAFVVKLSHHVLICILQFVLSFYSIEKYITTSAYKAELDDEMSFEIGVLVTVIEKNFDGWWLVR